MLSVAVAFVSFALLLDPCSCVGRDQMRPPSPCRSPSCFYISLLRRSHLLPALPSFLRLLLLFLTAGRPIAIAHKHPPTHTGTPPSPSLSPSPLGTTPPCLPSLLVAPPAAVAVPLSVLPRRWWRPCAHALRVCGRVVGAGRRAAGLLLLGMGDVGMGGFVFWKGMQGARWEGGGSAKRRGLIGVKCVWDQPI